MPSRFSHSEPPEVVDIARGAYPHSPQSDALRPRAHIRLRTRYRFAPAGVAVASFDAVVSLIFAASHVRWFRAVARP